MFQIKYIYSIKRNVRELKSLSWTHYHIFIFRIISLVQINENNTDIIIKFLNKHNQPLSLSQLHFSTLSPLTFLSFYYLCYESLNKVKKKKSTIITPWTPTTSPPPPFHVCVWLTCSCKIVIITLNSNPYLK